MSSIFPNFAKQMIRPYVLPLSSGKERTLPENTEYIMNTHRDRILFVCLGNICRSPMAEAVMDKMLAASGLNGRFSSDSAGIGGWHIGTLPDVRMRRCAAAHGYSLTHRARQFDPASDFSSSYLIVAMDADNRRDLLSMARIDADREKVVMMADFFSPSVSYTSVPDPYYGDEEDFETALSLIEEGCRGLISRLQAQKTRA